MKPKSRSRIVLGVFALFILLIGAISLISGQQSAAPAATPTKPSTLRPAGPPSAAVIKQLQESHGFQAFVGYASDSFQPATTSIKVGQTIRFTNNSDHDIWVGQITTINTPAHPNIENCDVPFNSCHTLHSDDFAEFTFPTKGTYYYMDNLNPATRGVVIVK